MPCRSDGAVKISVLAITTPAGRLRRETAEEEDEEEEEEIDAAFDATGGLVITAPVVRGDGRGPANVLEECGTALIFDPKGRIDIFSATATREFGVLNSAHRDKIYGYKRVCNYEMCSLLCTLYIDFMSRGGLSCWITDKISSSLLVGATL